MAKPIGICRALSGVLKRAPKLTQQRPWAATVVVASMIVILALGAAAFYLLTPDKQLQRVAPAPPEIHMPAKEDSTAMLGKLYFLGIGINVYRDTAAKLRFAVEDIMRIRETLKNRNPRSRTIDFRPPLLNSEATRERIIHEIETLRANLGVNDLGIVAFSSFEWIGEGGEFYILPYDGDPKRPSETAISAADIFRVMPNSRGKVVLWLDTCHSGQLAQQMEHVNPTIMTFASCAANEVSVELEAVSGAVHIGPRARAGWGG